MKYKGYSVEVLVSGKSLTNFNLERPQQEMVNTKWVCGSHQASEWYLGTGLNIERENMYLIRARDFLLPWSL